MTKKEQKRIAKDMLGKDFLLPEDKQWLLSLFSNHPEWPEKKGVGVADIQRKRTRWGNYCFWIIRADGSQTDISYNHCISGKPTKRSEIVKACRSAVEKEIIDFRNTIQFGEDKCCITGEVLTPENTHIDHYDLTFAEVFAEWVSGKDIDSLYKLINFTADGDTRTYFVDPAIRLDFLKYHNQNTHLRAVTKHANLVILKKQ